MILKTEHHNKLIFQLPTDHFDVVHAVLEDYNTVATNEKEAHCECFGIRNGSVNELHIYCDGRGEIFGGTIGKLYLFGHAALAYYGPSCIEGTIEELHVYRRARLSTDMKTLQHLVDTGCKMWFETGAVVNIDDRYYPVRLEQTADTFLNNLKTAEKFNQLMEEKILGHVEADNWRVNGHDTGIPLESVAARVKTAMEKHTYVPPKTEVKVSQTEDGHMKADITIEPGDIQKGPFTVRQLIEALQKCKNQDAPVFAYLTDAGVRLDMIRVDDGFDDNRMVDLNVDDEPLWRTVKEQEGDSNREDRQQ